MYRKRMTIVLIFILILSISGCSHRESSVLESEPLVTYQSEKIFRDEYKGIENLLGIIGGRININYAGDKKWAECGYEIWANGVMVEDSPIFSTTFKDKELELTVILQELINDDLVKSEFISLNTGLYDKNGSGGSSTRKYIKGFKESPKGGYFYSSTEMDKSIKTSNKNEVKVWCYSAQKDGNMISDIIVEDKAKAADWALVIKIKFKDEK